MTVNRKLLPWTIAAGAAELLLASWQWFELESLRRGGEAPFCAINARVSCQTVWTSPMAMKIGQAIGIPVAGLGVVWGLVATFLALMLWGRARSGESAASMVTGVRLTALAGALAVLAFIAGSVESGAVCLTCLGTYVLVAVYVALAAGCAERRLPAGRDLAMGVAWAGVGALVVGSVVWFQAKMLGSSRSTGAEEILRLSSHVPADATPDQALAAVLAELPPDGRQFISAVRQYYVSSPPAGFAREPRERFGPPDAPVRIVEWTDVRCPHCRDLLQAIKVIKRVVPAGRLSVESRQFPLDSECNHGLKGTDGTGLRCLGARALICNEGTPEFADITSGIFEAQDSLSTEAIMEIASSGSVGRAALERCVISPETERKLQDDIAYADQFQPRGTPFVILNGKVMPPVPLPAFIYSLALVSGRTDSPAFSTLPPPPTE